MEIVSEHTHRVLAYVDALNRHGVKPQPGVVNEFAKKPEQLLSTTSPIAGAMYTRALLRSMLMFQPSSVEAETFCQYMTRLKWTYDKAVVELTPVGRALLKALNSPVLEETTADVFEIVLSPDNEFAYAQALGALGSVKQALLVEPYFRLEQLMDVAELDNIERVLIGPNMKPRELKVLATGLATVVEQRPLEVRIAKALHDRYLVPKDEGAVLMLGISLGGIGKKVSTLTTLGALASQALREAHEAIWNEAETLKPREPATLPGSIEEPSEIQPATKKAVAPRKASGKKTASAPADKAQD